MSNIVDSSTMRVQLFNGPVLRMKLDPGKVAEARTPEVGDNDTRLFPGGTQISNALLDTETAADQPLQVRDLETFQLLKSLLVNGTHPVREERAQAYEARRAKDGTLGGLGVYDPAA